MLPHVLALTILDDTTLDDGVVVPATISRSTT